MIFSNKYAKIEAIAQTAISALIKRYNSWLLLYNTTWYFKEYYSVWQIVQFIKRTILPVDIMSEMKVIYFEHWAKLFLDFYNTFY